jgi:molybdenum cofactor cytidylyltransferase
MASSLALGLTALGDGVDGALVCLGDMPRIEAADLRALIDAFRTEHGPDACVPVHEGRRGNPVLWSSRCFPALRSLQGDRGGKALLEERGTGVIEVPVPGRGVLFDVDTPDALERAVREFPV